MPIPDFQSVILPVLRLSAEGEIKLADAVNRISNEFGLSEHEREEVLPSGSIVSIKNRISWSVTYLVYAGLVERPRRGHFVITEQGKSVLLENPKRIDISFLSRFEGFNEFRTGNGDEQSTTGDGEMNQSPIVAETPEERIQEAFEEMNETLRDDLLKSILEASPEFFEKLIVDLMLGMGYGSKGTGERIGKVGDGGVDGIINEDALGLDVVYLQAKRYSLDNHVGIREIREFAGALDGKGAKKGVFVTTSSFARNAKTFVDSISIQKRLRLIDGDELTRLMVEYGVGVRDQWTLTSKRVDTDYFEEN